MPQRVMVLVIQCPHEYFTSVTHMLIFVEVNMEIEGNLHDKEGKDQKPVIVTDYYQHMGYVKTGDRVTKSYPVSWRIWKWTKIFFPLHGTKYTEYLRIYHPVILQ
jgi:hypothetical protein